MSRSIEYRVEGRLEPVAKIAEKLLAGGAGGPDSSGQRHRGDQGPGAVRSFDEAA